jgi:hypothetical protein
LYTLAHCVSPQSCRKGVGTNLVVQLSYSGWVVGVVVLAAEC